MTLDPYTQSGQQKRRPGRKARMASKPNELVMSCLLSGSLLLGLSSAPPALNDLFSSYLEKEKRKYSSPPFRYPRNQLSKPQAPSKLITPGYSLMVSSQGYKAHQVRNSEDKKSARVYLHLSFKTCTLYYSISLEGLSHKTTSYNQMLWDSPLLLFVPKQWPNTSLLL